jgi:glyoxylase-like metal-dependent hydrolase (beta-lactamase superfamily II)
MQRTVAMRGFQTGVMLGAVALCAMPAAAQDPLIRAEGLVQVSASTYVLPDDNVALVPNVGIVIGTEATLIVDTGLGPRNGETIRRVVDTLSDHETIYVVATHYHPEHSLGFAGIGGGARLVIPRVQEEEMAGGAGIRDNFASRSAVTAELLAGVEYPAADMPFDDEIVLDLGGLQARVFTRGPLHTRGDTIVWIEEERVLFTGDVVMQDIFPAFADRDGSVSRWLETLDVLEALNPQVIVGAHTDRGDRTLIAAWREYFETLQARVATLRAAGVTVDEAITTLTTEFEASRPGWRGSNRVAGAVRAAWNE